MKSRAILWSALLALGSAVALSAAPQLRLTSSALGPYVVTAGANLNSGQPIVVNAANIGSGSLSLQATSSVAWLSATVGAAQSCAVYKTCYPISITGQTSTLTTGTYTGLITVADPNAVDAPQSISVTVQVGSNVPSSLQFYLAPGGSTSATFTTSSPVTATSSAPWLSVGLQGSGTYSFAVPYKVTAAAGSSMAANTYNATLALAGSKLADDNKTVNVTLQVTTSPIAQPGVPVLNLKLAANSIKQTIPVGIGNSGMGTLTLSSVTAAAANSGTWLTAANTGNVVSITADPTSLNPGLYTGTVTVKSNAVNTPVIDVNLTVVAQSAPLANFQGVVNNATFVPGESVAPGDIIALFGEQFLYSESPVFASATPLPTTLGGSSGTQVLVNGQPAPLYFASYNQIDFQMPYEAQAGQAVVQVVRGGQTGNSVSVEVAKNQPRILPFGYGNYGIIQNATQGGFAVSTAAGTALGLPTVHPAKAGTDFLTIYAIGLGATSPAVQTGAAASGTILSHVSLPTTVTFSATNPFAPSVTVTPSFAGLAPSFVALYQINVQVPANSPKGDSVPLYLTSGSAVSNTVYIAVQ